MTSHSPIVATIDVVYPNGFVPTSSATIPANSINSHALTKNKNPAAGRLKKVRTVSLPHVCIQPATARAT